MHELSPAARHGLAYGIAVGDAQVLQRVRHGQPRGGEELDADGEDVYADAARTDADSIRAALNGDAK